MSRLGWLDWNKIAILHLKIPKTLSDEPEPTSVADMANREEMMKIVASKGFISTMVDRIVERFQPLQVVLFGSHARGTANAWSDVDLLVVLPDVSDKRAAAVDIRRTLGDLPVCKDIVVATPEEIARRGHLAGTVLRSALREGKIVYERA